MKFFANFRNLKIPKGSGTQFSRSVVIGLLITQQRAQIYT